MAGESILVVGDDYYASLAAVRALRAGGYVPSFAAAEADTLAASSRATEHAARLPHPSRGADAFVDAIAEVAAGLGARAVLPGTEAALAALAGRDDRFDGVLGAPAPELVRAVTDKTSLAEAARAAGLRSPESTPLEEATGLSFPVILKPVQTAVRLPDRTLSLPPTRRVDSAAELETIRRDLPDAPFVIQPFIDGRLGALAGVAWEGKLVCASQQLARRIYPTTAGASSFAESVPLEPGLIERAERLLAGIGWSGIWELQFIATRDDWYLIDFNPRFYGSLALAVAAGLNLPVIWTDLLLGREPRVGSYRPGNRYRAEVRDARALLVAARTRGARALVDGLPQRHTTHAVFSLRDPLPFVTLGTRPLRRVLRTRNRSQQLETP